MVLNLFQELFLGNDAFLHATDLIANNIISNRADDNVIIMCLNPSAILAIIQDKTRPFESIAIKAKDVGCCQRFIIYKILINKHFPFAKLLKFAFRLTMCHLLVGSEVKTQAKIFSNTTLREVDVFDDCICAMIENHAKVPPIRLQYAVKSSTVFSKEKVCSTS